MISQVRQRLQRQAALPEVRAGLVGGFKVRAEQPRRRPRRAGIDLGFLHPIALALEWVGGQRHAAPARVQLLPADAATLAVGTAQTGQHLRVLVLSTAHRGHGYQIHLAVLLDGGQQHRVRAALDKDAVSVLHQLFHGGGKQYRRAQVAAPIGRVQRRGCQRPADGRIDWHSRQLRLDGFQRLHQLGFQPIHVRAVRGHIHFYRAHEHAFGLQLRADLFQRGRVTGDDRGTRPVTDRDR